MGIDFFLINGQSVFQFPVNPEEVNISRQKGYETVTMLTHGEFDFPQGEKVKEITFSSFFPRCTMHPIVVIKISQILTKR